MRICRTVVVAMASVLSGLAMANTQPNAACGVVIKAAQGAQGQRNQEIRDKKASNGGNGKGAETW